MAKSEEPQQPQDSTMQYQLAMFWAFSDQQSIGLSVKSISTVAPINISSSINNQGFCKQLSSYTLITIYQHLQHFSFYHLSPIDSSENLTYETWTRELEKDCCHPSSDLRVTEKCIHIYLTLCA